MVTCKQRADHFTPMMWIEFIRWRFHLIRGRFHYSNCIRLNQNDVTHNCISPETHNWYMYTAWEIETQNLWLTQMTSQAPVCFLWNNLWSVSRYLWSVSRYIMGPFSGWWRLVGGESQYLTLPFENVGQESVITDSHFSWICFHITDFIQIWLFVHWIFAYRRCDNRDNVQFVKSWENYAKSFAAGLNIFSTKTLSLPTTIVNWFIEAEWCIYASVI